MNLQTQNLWSQPQRVAVVENDDSIEFVYKEISLTSSLEERVFKIVFSCVDGKWNKSERIYGKIVPQQQEYYIFLE